MINTSQTVPLKKLSGWDKNPRGIKKDDYNRLKKQIQDLGVYKPLLVNEDYVVLGGNMRLKVLTDLGVENVWVSVVKASTPEMMAKYALSDNDEAGYYEEQALAELLMPLEINLDDYRVNLGKPISITELLAKFGPDVIEDEPPALEKEAISKRGEIYQLGRHRLMCGDATSIEDVEALMDGKKADMVFTDPPYGVDYEGGTKEKLKIDNDINTDAFAEALPNYISVSKAGASYYVCCPANNNFIDFLKPFSDYCYQSSTIIWAKNSMVLGHGDYHYQHEPILYGWVKGASHQYYGDRTQTTLWNVNRPTISKYHPTMKPLALCAKAINNSSKTDDIVLDLFGGSGSTLIACEQTNRTCYMSEIDPRYCDVIRKRYALFIGKGDKWEKITPLISNA